MKKILMITSALLIGTTSLTFAQDNSGGAAAGAGIDSMVLPDEDDRARGGVTVESETVTEQTIPDRTEVEKIRSEEEGRQAQEKKDILNKSLNSESDSRVQDLGNPSEVGVPATANTRIDLN